MAFSARLLVVSAPGGLSTISRRAALIVVIVCVLPACFFPSDDKARGPAEPVTLTPAEVAPALLGLYSVPVFDDATMQYAGEWPLAFFPGTTVSEFCIRTAAAFEPWSVLYPIVVTAVIDADEYSGDWSDVLRVSIRDGKVQQIRLPNLGQFPNWNGAESIIVRRESADWVHIFEMTFDEDQLAQQTCMDEFRIPRSWMCARHTDGVRNLPSELQLPDATDGDLRCIGRGSEPTLSDMVVPWGFVAATDATHISGTGTQQLVRWVPGEPDLETVWVRFAVETTGPDSALVSERSGMFHIERFDVRPTAGQQPVCSTTLDVTLVPREPFFDAGRKQVKCNTNTGRIRRVVLWRRG